MSQIINAKIQKAIGLLGEVQASLAAVPAAADEQSLTTDQIAARLNVNPETIRRWAKQGCPHLSRGRVRRFELDVVRAWLASRGGAL